MQPKPRADTSRPLFPNDRFCIQFPCFESNDKRRLGGIPILPNDCLILPKLIQSVGRPGCEAVILVTDMLRSQKAVEASAKKPCLAIVLSLDISIVREFVANIS